MAYSELSNFLSLYLHICLQLITFVNKIDYGNKHIRQGICSMGKKPC
jgi:hypothetical protein